MKTFKLFMLGLLICSLSVLSASFAFGSPGDIECPAKKEMVSKVGQVKIVVANVAEASLACHFAKSDIKEPLQFAKSNGLSAVTQTLNRHYIPPSRNNAGLLVSDSRSQSYRYHNVNHRYRGKYLGMLIDNSKHRNRQHIYQTLRT